MLSQEAIATFQQDPHPRLSLQAPLRIALGSTTAGFVGLGLGATQGGKTAHLRFRAEHAHKMPDSTTGWYLYHKSKNYHAAIGGGLEGIKMGTKLAFWSGMALSLETTVDRCRGASDMFSTIIASLSVAGAFSLWHRFPVTTAARNAKSGLLFGFAYGGAQDFLNLIQGRPVGYIDFIRGRGRGRGRSRKEYAAEQREATATP
ncbi:uncharacterized protein J7T54_006650 [Emericellopsis cladophorae]|uniref:Uncharacterized protein n=1 Tax=Emericellopsis cladophorae TaxID=2686198 RepID=A0A9P9Y7W0_9HYPO|nr:uncharacterized protein J7T54_006650 [Emericellopsis cladophorae]KAI6784605.1 hypothetical protein J7T54_006650 [Emericellopsis cladophorae]